MKPRKAAGLAAGAVIAMIGAPIVCAQADSQNVDELNAQIRSLEQRLIELEQSSGDQWLTEQRSSEIRNIVEDVLADADTRASLLGNGMTAGYNNGFYLSSADGNFSLNMSGQLQTRFVLNNTDGDVGDSTRWGFENTRTKLWFTGNIVNPNWVYMIEGDFSRDGGTFSLLDSYIGYVFDDSGWIFLMGQFKVPMLREEMVDSRYQLAIERSVMNEEFTAGRTQGVALDYRNDNFHMTAGVTDGHPATGTFNTTALTANTEISLTVRAELLLSGAWDQFNDFTSWKGEESAFMLGAAAHYQDGEYGTMADEIEVFQWTLDASAEFGGANIMAAIVGRHLEATGLDLDQYGAVVQGGFFLNDDWELYGRYEWGDSDTSAEDLSIFTVGVNRYYDGNNAKWTTDVGFGLNEVSGFWADGFLGGGGDIAGWRTDAADDDGQIVFRSQLQLLF